MSLILSVQGVSKYFSADPVLDRVSFDIRAGDRISLIGPNGAGKTTLLKILAGELEPDRGELHWANNVRVGVLEQRPEFDSDATIRSVAASALAQIHQWMSESQQVAVDLAEATDPHQRRELERRYDQLQSLLQQHDAYSADARLESVLTGLGFAADSFDQPVSQLSGGQVNRLMLAKLLLSDADLMLLDEPSNHLDISATEWLESFLLKSRQAFLLISHDRYFLDRVVSQTLELVNGRIDSFPGNYSQYYRLKQERLEVQRRTYEKQAAEIARIEDFIRRNHYGQKHTQAEDRRKKLERIERVAPPREISVPPMRFPQASRAGDIVLSVDRLRKSFDGKPLFRDFSLQIEREQRWAILGPNGCGKSTLLNCLVNKIKCDEGSVRFGAGVRVGYFDQQLKSVRGDLPAYEAIRPDHKEMVDVERRDLLARFGITGDLALQPVERLSGGERNRVALAYLAAQEPNFLIMDEPTNHLDLWARHALEQALIEFNGTLLMVSHDRYFINQIATHLIVFDENGPMAFEGNYDTWCLMRADNMARPAESGKPEDDRPARSPRTNSNAQRRKRKFKYRKLEDIESDIERLEDQVDEIYKQMLQPEVLRDREKFVALQQKKQEISDALEELYDHWEEALELN